MKCLGIRECLTREGEGKGRVGDENGIEKNWKVARSVSERKRPAG